VGCALGTRCSRAATTGCGACALAWLIVREGCGRCGCGAGAASTVEGLVTDGTFRMADRDLKNPSIFCPVLLEGTEATPITAPVVAS